MSKTRRIQKAFTQNEPAFLTAKWVFRDFAVRYAASLVAIAALGAAAAGLQAATLFGAQYLLGAIASDKPTNVPLLNIEVSSSDAASFGGLFLLVALGISAVLTFVQNWMVLNLWYRYQLHSLDSLLLAVQGACQRGSITLQAIGAQAVRKLLRSVQRLGPFTRIAAGSIAPALRFLVFSSYAVISNPFLTAVLLIAFIPAAGLALLFFARGASRCTRMTAKLARKDTEELDAHLEAAAKGLYTPFNSRTTKGESAIEGRARAMIGRILWVEYSRLFTTVITVTVIGLFLILSVNTGILGGHSWSDIIFYFIALVIAFRELIALASSISNIGRFYPAIMQQKTVLEALQHASSAKQFWRALEKVGISTETIEFEDEA